MSGFGILRRSIVVVMFGIVACGRPSGERQNAENGATDDVPTWTVDTIPVLTLGRPDDTTEMFQSVAGATRLPTGEVVVGDPGPFSIHVYSPQGKRIRSLGRNGDGPGEISGMISRLYRCGDTIAAVGPYISFNKKHVSLFALDGRFVRRTTLWAPRGQSAYRSSCNRKAVFAHYGLAMQTVDQPGYYRTTVPFWLDPVDSATGVTLGEHPGDERWVWEGTGGGSMPLPLGRQTAIALDDDRVYIGPAIGYEIQVLDLKGKALPSIRKSVPPSLTTPEDINTYSELHVATMTPSRAAEERRMLSTVEFPDTLPAYGELVVDHDHHLWVQDYPRPNVKVTGWTVFDHSGKTVARVFLPRYLEVYEIGADYVLGRYLDPDVSVPEVRIYALRRTP